MQLSLMVFERRYQSERTWGETGCALQFLAPFLMRADEQQLTIFQLKRQDIRGFDL